MNSPPSFSASVFVPERRPMFTREWNISKQLADWLVRKGASPNAISLAGMGAGIVAGLALALTGQSSWTHTGFLLAVLAIILRGMGNVLDGMVAVKRGTACPLGRAFQRSPGPRC